MSTNHFKPAWWLPSAHLQVFWASYIRRKPTIVIKNERFELPDGDYVDLAWAGEDNGPLAFLLHGLQGSVDSPYIRGIMKALTEEGWRTVLMHFRGCSGEPNRLAKAYHAGDIADVATVLHALTTREPHTPIATIGYSLGGNILLNYLAKYYLRQIKAAVAVSVPYVLSEAAMRLSSGFSRVYQWSLLRSIRQTLKQKEHLLPPEFTHVDLNSLHEFDEKVTAPLNGFADASDYYRRTSSRPLLKHIETPTLLIHAADDPFMTQAVVPSHTELSPHVTLELYPRGSHVGFISGQVPWRPTYWLEHRIPAYLNSMLKQNSSL